MKNLKKYPWWVLGALVLLAVILLLSRCSGSDPGVPTLIVETPQKLSASERSDFTLDVTVSTLG